MYFLKKKISISIAHRLVLDYSSPCSSLHGHNLCVIIYCKSEKLNIDGMIIDFNDIKKIVNRLDHQYLNSRVCFNPTAENIARYLCEQIPFCYKVKVRETKNNEIIYEI